MAGEDRRNRHVGIAGLGYYLPDTIITAEEMAARSGIPVSVFYEKVGMHQKHVAGADEHPAGMGVSAAQQAIGRAGIDPAEIGIVAYCGAGFYDYQFWSPAAKVAHAVGAKNAYAFEVRNGCNGGNLAIAACKNLLMADPEKSAALVVAADKFSIAIDYTNPKSFSVFNAADGAAAAVLRKGEPSNKILAYASISDGSIADAVKLPCGGTRVPATLDGADERGRFICVDDPEELQRIFDRTYLANYQSVIREALSKSGHSLAGISHIFTNQVKVSLSSDILDSLGLGPEKTLITMAEYGHMGPVDTLFGLARSIEAGRIKKGDVVVLASSGLGFVWAATVIEYT